MDNENIENNENNEIFDGDVMDKIVNVDIESEMRKSYIDYAMSVIVARALPDVRDGLKPVHRRILHSMNELNLEPNKPYKKSARIVGDTMGKYHPHGESSIYDALVRMAQEFSIRYMLVDGHGNFGSIDGDMAAAQRYTEARLSYVATEMLRDIDKDTVDFIPNYDEEFKEPTVLPSRFPNLLVNGSVGIAVGMATNIPPHNLGEVTDAILRIIDNSSEGKDTAIEEVLAIVKGPDFPTGATILGTSGIREAYRTGRGRLTVRSVTEIEPMGGGKERIIVSEIPYQVNKARLVEKIAEMVKEKRVDGITDLRDESDKHGIRIVIELRKDANAPVILNNLYKHTQLQETFSVIMLALVKGEPKTLNLMDILWAYLDHQKDVITRRSLFDLNKAQTRAHIVEGFLKALDYIDEIIAIIRANREISRSKAIIMEQFGFTQAQADAIVELRLRSLSGLEREKLEDEFDKLMKLISELQGILGDEKKLLSVIREELVNIRRQYADERRTQIVPQENEFDTLDFIDEETNVVTLTNLNYIKRLHLDTYRSQARGGKGVIGMTTRDEDTVKKLFVASTHDEILFFTDFGKVYRLNAYEIPETGRLARGTAIVNLLNLSGEERIAAVIPMSNYDKGYLMMVTRDGVVKKTPVNQFAGVKKGGLIALSIKDGDELISVLHTTGDDEILMVTRNAQGICFSENDVRSMGRTAAGVRGINLKEGDAVIGALVVSKDAKLLTVSELGYGKTTELEELRAQKRGGYGLKTYRVNDKTGMIVAITLVKDDDEFMLINSEGHIIRIPVSDVRTVGRVAMGVRLINLAEGVQVVGLASIDQALLEEKSEETDEEPGEEGTVETIIDEVLSDEDKADEDITVEDEQPEGLSEQTDGDVTDEQ